MVNGVINPGSGAGDFALQRFDARFEIGKGQWAQILSEQSGQRIIGLSGQIVIHVHDVQC
ncbi:hypothetical protein M527_20890 [Sphingobium indicum IP26]|uniref:Uncharacterized protein n=1 Tax=Sphingobium indicum F2 TaxID=1450518 RepID=A0A8E0WQZ7_9SPHN|nr:hypothetical protein M527_20890 [Sphingobium indicum IP26]EQA99363.1 hypothetical protein L286_19860 [Sphingobium sp. HDIP04]KER35716.1 hypothetical protein AL00_14550 [Sphingobium indicum F2]